MNNFINVRLQAYNNTKQLNILKHNTRKIESLSKLDEFKTNYVVLNDGELFDLKEKLTRDTLYNTLKKFYDKDRKVHNEKMYERRQRNLTNQQASWMEGVFTFSEAIKSDLGNKYTIEELSRVANNCAQDLAKQTGSELKYLVLHQDETTLHFHFALKNFDENGHSIFHKIKHKEILAKIQDLGFKHFGELGMDRGISKEITGKNYQNITNYYKQQQIELKAIIQSLQVEVKQIQSNKKDILNNLDLTKQQKKEELDKLDLDLKNLRNTIGEYKDIKNENDEKLKLKVEELKTLNNDINVANDTLNDLNKKINIKTQEVNSFEQVLVKNEDIINNLINNNITKNVIKQDVVVDLDKLKKDFNVLVNKTLKIDLKQKNLQEKDEQIKRLEDQNNTLLDKLNHERNKNKILEQDKVQISEQSKKAIELMDKQQKVLQRQIRTNTRIRRQRQRLMQKIMRDNNLTKVIHLKKHLKTTPIKAIKKDIKEIEDCQRDR